MSRVTDALLIATVVAGALWTYTIKHEADEQARELHKIREEIRTEEGKIALLEADWAIATAPARLAKVVARYREELRLEELSSTATMTEQTWPAMRPPPEPALEASGEDPIRTGGIEALLDRVENLE
jgi:hypothetical protein